jgi:hypothetical protein
MRRNHLILVSAGLMLCSALAFAAPPTASPGASPSAPPSAALRAHDELVAATKALVAQNNTLRALVAQYEAKAKAKALLEAKIGALQKELASTPDAKRRAELQQQLDASSTLRSDITAVMLEYQKLLNKEAREDKRLADLARDSKIRLKLDAAKDGTQIAAMKQEAEDRADAAMTAASIQLNLGIVSGLMGLGVGKTPPTLGSVSPPPRLGGVGVDAGVVAVDAGAR